MVYISLMMKKMSPAYARPSRVRALALLACVPALAFPALRLHAGEVPPDVVEEKRVRLPAGGVITEGIAAYYADRFNGRKTGSGVRYDPEKLTAAHPDLPYGTKVKVVNLANDREVVVTVNDRCRRKSFPFIDLSRAAARKLGFLGKGTARVAFTILDGFPEQ